MDREKFIIERSEMVKRTLEEMCAKETGIFTGIFEIKVWGKYGQEIVYIRPENTREEGIGRVIYIALTEDKIKDGYDVVISNMSVDEEELESQIKETAKELLDPEYVRDVKFKNWG